MNLGTKVGTMVKLFCSFLSCKKKRNFKFLFFFRGLAFSFFCVTITGNTTKGYSLYFDLTGQNTKNRTSCEKMVLFCLASQDKKNEKEQLFIKWRLPPRKQEKPVGGQVKA